MATLRSIILGFVAVMTVGAASAKTIDKPVKEKTTVNYAVDAYVKAVSLGQNAGLGEVLDNSNFKLTMVRGENTVTYNKTEFLDFMKTTEDVKQDCKVVVTPNEGSPDATVVKVSMEYKDFTRVNYVTLNNTSDGWKITSIYSVFK